MIKKLLREALLNENEIIIFHGTLYKFLEKIKNNGLVSKKYYDAEWFMASTDFESALFHATPNEGESAYVIEFKVPLTNEKWEGYPYFWPPYVRKNGEKWFALKKPLSPELITNVHAVDYEKYLEQKNKGF